MRPPETDSRPQLPLAIPGPPGPAARRSITLVAKDRGRRLDEVLDRALPEFTRSGCQKLVRRGFVTIDGRRVLRSNGRIGGTERIGVELEAAAPLILSVVALDDDLIVVDKPAGMLVHANERQADGAVADLLDARLGPLPRGSGAERPGIVHRLDRETSGLMVVARTDLAMQRLRDEFRQRRVSKRYLALVHGLPPEDAFEVDLALSPSPDGSDYQRADPAGKPARTSFRTLERFADAALVECRPESGRRHQIRVHLAQSGLPIVGDRLYRPSGWSGPSDLLGRHALHAAELAFEHPARAGRVQFEAPLPADMQRLLERLRSS